MGWTTTNKPEGEKIIDFLARHSINCANEHGTWALLKGKVIKGVAYMAIRRTFPEGSGKESYVFAGVFKVQMYPKDRYNFGYKDMDESELPYYYDCTNDILDLLSPTDCKNANQWRTTCRERNTASAAIKLTAGVLVRFNDLLGFTDGFSGTDFRVEDARRGHVSPIVKQSSLYVIKGLRDYLVRGTAKIIGDSDVGTATKTASPTLQPASGFQPALFGGAS